jgi:prevent-host-death family protein
VDQSLVYIQIMEIALSEAKARLTDLARRAERGEVIFLTRHGHPVAQITGLTNHKPKRTIEQKRAALDAIATQGQIIREKYGFTAQQLQDDISSDDGIAI